jgi:copper chaperone CopZ
MTTNIKITGMHCASCKTLIEEVCREAAGVTACDVDLAGGTGTIEHDDRFDLPALAKEINALGGYSVEAV